MIPWYHSTLQNDGSGNQASTTCQGRDRWKSSFVHENPWVLTPFSGFQRGVTSTSF